MRNCSWTLQNALCLAARREEIERRRKPGTDLVLILIYKLSRRLSRSFRAHSLGIRGDMCFVTSFAVAFAENCPQMMVHMHIKCASTIYTCFRGSTLTRSFRGAFARGVFAFGGVPHMNPKTKSLTSREVFDAAQLSCGSYRRGSWEAAQSRSSQIRGCS